MCVSPHATREAKKVKLTFVPTAPGKQYFLHVRLGIMPGVEHLTVQTVFFDDFKKTRVRNYTRLSELGVLLPGGPSEEDDPSDDFAPYTTIDARPELVLFTDLVHAIAKTLLQEHDRDGKFSAEAIKLCQTMLPYLKKDDDDDQSETTILSSAHLWAALDVCTFVRCWLRDTKLEVRESAFSKESNSSSNLVPMEPHIILLDFVQWSGVRRRNSTSTTTPTRKCITPIPIFPGMKALHLVASYDEYVGSLMIVSSTRSASTRKDESEVVQNGQVVWDSVSHPEQEEVTGLELPIEEGRFYYLAVEPGRTGGTLEEFTFTPMMEQGKHTELIQRVHQALSWLYPNEAPCQESKRDPIVMAKLLDAAVRYSHTRQQMEDDNDKDEMIPLVQFMKEYKLEIESTPEGKVILSELLQRLIGYETARVNEQKQHQMSNSIFGNGGGYQQFRQFHGM